MTRSNASNVTYNISWVTTGSTPSGGSSTFDYLESDHMYEFNLGTAMVNWSDFTLLGYNYDGYNSNTLGITISWDGMDDPTATSAISGSMSNNTMFTGVASSMSASDLINNVTYTFWIIGEEAT